jgi:hypothetical protein
MYLNLSCNSISGHGAAELTAMFSQCPLLAFLDLDGIAIGDEGCMTLGAALVARAVPSLNLLDLSTNHIEDRDCVALAPLFGGGVRVDGSCCPSLTHVTLRENGIELCVTFFVGGGKEVAGAAMATMLPSLTLLDLSWNSIANFGVLLQAPAFSGSSSMCPLLLELDLKDN